MVSILDGRHLQQWIHGREYPVLAIAIHHGYRNRGIGRRMIAWLIDRVSKHSLARISLSVSKDNRALKLYRELGFREHVDRVDAFTMVSEIRAP